MTVAELLSRAGVSVGSGKLSNEKLQMAPTGVFYDSREVIDGGVFVAVRGTRFNGAAFANDARARGAAVAVSEEAQPLDASLPWIRVPDTRVALAALAAAFYGNPSHALKVVGVTGTNGKTTTTYLIESIFTQAGIKTGRISSISNRSGPNGPAKRSIRTTPESPDVQAWLGMMLEEKTDACVMEVSSHALALRRVENVQFSAAVFTNLSRDHLEFHGDMDRYFAAKSRLFEMLPEDAPSVLNVDDKRGRELALSVRRPVTYGIECSADVRPTRLDLAVDATRLDVRTPRGMVHLESAFVGRMAAYNLLAATATSVALDVPFHGIEEGVRGLACVPGRMQTITGSDDDVTVVVDFAHTAAALRGLLEAVRIVSRGRVITVFGCGGDRDVAKRPLMGAVAARLSDQVIVTSDNPRTERPLDIIADIERGIQQMATPCIAIADREEAIGRAIAEAAPSDMVVLAGKGHEKYQEIGPQAVPFDDAAIAQAALLRRRSSLRVG